jgi:Polyphosphate kinase 2 (PPK2)
VRERAHWDEYVKAYEAMVRATATPHAPWYVVPADNKWFTRIVIAAAAVDAMESLHLQYPRVDRRKRAEIEEARKLLLQEEGE